MSLRYRDHAATTRMIHEAGDRVDGRRVLVVEDQADTTRSVITELYEHGFARVEEATDFQKAAGLLESQTYDLILADLCIPRGDSTFMTDGGVVLLAELHAGSFGNPNESTPFVILTAYDEDVDERALMHFPQFFGVIAKTRPKRVLARLAERCGHLMPWLIVEEDDDPPHIRWDLLAINGFPKEGLIEAQSSAWPAGDRFPIRQRDLPFEIWHTIETGRRPVYLWAKINTLAEQSDDLIPHAFRLSNADEDSKREFDRAEDPQYEHRVW